MTDFTLSPPILAAILCNAPPSSFSAPPPDNYCTVPKDIASLQMLASLGGEVKAALALSSFFHCRVKSKET